MSHPIRFWFLHTACYTIGWSGSRHSIPRNLIPLNAAERSDTVEATEKPLSATVFHHIVCSYQEAVPHRLLPEPEDTLKL